MLILSHSGKQHSYQVAKALKDLGLLHKFCTSSYIGNPFLQNTLLKKGDTFWTRRFLPGLTSEHVEANWRFEIKELLLRRFNTSSERVQQAVYQRDLKFDQYIAKKLSKIKGQRSKVKDVFWGYQGSCNHSLQSAKKSGLTTLCELSTAHVTAAQLILGEEQKLHSEWADSFDNLVFPAWYQKRLEEEPHLADYAIAASDFTRQSLLQAGVANNKIKVLPLGFEAEHISFGEGEPGYGKRPLKILYAGRITQRKGIKYLLEAMHYFGTRQVELHLVGFVHGSGDGLKPFKGLYQHHPPVSQAELFRLYQQYDVLALPTIFEGFGLVIVEAMAAGLPVITTPHSIGPELITHDQNGYIVPIRDTQAIVQSIENLLNKTPEQYLAMRHAARQAALSFTWETYRDRLKAMFKNL